MKCIQLYLLTCIITGKTKVEAVGAFSPEDLQFIAGRLKPSECSQLLRDLSGAHEGSKVSVIEHRPFANNKVTEHFRAQCLESLIECNERGKKGGCTRIGLEGALHKLGREDLVSQLKRRWKKNSRSKKKSTSRPSKRPRNGRIDQGRSHEKSRRKVLTSHRSNTINNHGNKGEDDFFGKRFITFLVAATFLIITILGCIMIVSYRRACRCYKEYLKEYDFNEQKIFDKPFSTSGTGRPISSQTQDVLQREDEYIKLVEESDKAKRMAKNVVATQVDGSSRKIGPLDPAEKSAVEGCKCNLLNETCRKDVSLCERIKRFFDFPKCHLCDTKGAGRKRNKSKNRASKKKRRESLRKDFVTKKPKNQDSGKNKPKHNRKKLKKFSSSKVKRTNRERKAQGVRPNCKCVEGHKLLACACEVRRLSDETRETGYSEETKLIRR